MGLIEITEDCIYCGTNFEPFKGDGDHILPVQLGEFRNDQRFRRICSKCNNKIGHSEQQLLVCGPESFFRRIVKPKVPKKRQRGNSQIAGAKGVPSPESTIDCGDHRQLVRRSDENPLNVIPFDQIVIHDEGENEYFIKLFKGMKSKHIRNKIAELGIAKFNKIWLHCDEPNWNEFEKLIKETFHKDKMECLKGTDTGIHQVDGRVTFKVNDHYFRSIVKIAFHYYLTYTRRGYRGDESFFSPIRNFIMNGGDHEHFFNQKGPQFAMPFGDLPSGGVITPEQWCHVLSAYEVERSIIVYLQLFVGRGCIPTSHHIKLAEIDNRVIAPHAVWGHVYLYDETSSSDRFAGEVKKADLTRLK